MKNKLVYLQEMTGRTCKEKTTEKQNKQNDWKIIKVCVLIFISVIFTSCDCVQRVEGVVIDAETQLPIDKVKIMKADTENTFVEYTDSLGNFEFYAISGGLFGCPKILLSFEKEGYIKINKKYNPSTRNVVVILKKQTDNTKNK